MNYWIRSPCMGGVRIPKEIQAEVCRRILEHAEKNYAGTYSRIDIRFRGKFCYIDAFTEPYLPEGVNPPNPIETREEFLERLRNTPTHLCRLRYFGDVERWGVAFFTYSHEKYEETFFGSGSDFGIPEEAFDVGAVYLQ